MDSADPNVPESSVEPGSFQAEEDVAPLLQNRRATGIPFFSTTETSLSFP